jgi:glucokinase
MPSPGHEPVVLLIGDLGATSLRLALVAAGAGGPTTLREASLRSGDYTGLAAPVQEFLGGAPERPDRAVFAVAGPVVERRAELTNLGWRLEEHGLATSLGVGSVRLVNDLVAMAYAIPHLDADSLITLQAGRAAPGGTIALIAPGTGLGQAFLTQDGTTCRAHPSEGGHADFAPADQLQVELLGWMRSRFGHVSGERICSGRALPYLYAFLAERGQAPRNHRVAERLAGSGDRTPVIVEAALATVDSCPLCRATVELFAAILAAEAGNMALRTLATGGVYLGGGLPRRLLPVLRRPAFLDKFREKGRLSPLLARFPLHVVIRPNIGLFGALRYALATHGD